MPHDRIRSYGGNVAVVTVMRPGTPATAVALTVRSAEAASDRPRQVVVADSSGGDGPAVPDGVEVVRLGEDIGRGAAVNRVVAGLDGSIGWVALADPGVVWHPGSLAVLLAAARPRAAALGPLLRNPSGDVIRAGGAVPGVVDVLRDRPQTPQAGVVGWLPASCLLLRRAALDSVDGFDPRYVDEWGDVDLGDRLGRAGWLVLHVPAAAVTVHPTTGPRILEPRGVARRRYLRDRGPTGTRALLTLAVRGRR